MIAKANTCWLCAKRIRCEIAARPERGTKKYSATRGWRLLGAKRWRLRTKSSGHIGESGTATDTGTDIPVSARSGSVS